METLHKLNTELAISIKKLQKKQKREVLKFIEYLRTQEDSSFIKYINNRTMQAVEARKSGKHFTSLEELQREYA